MTKTTATPTHATTGEGCEPAAGGETVENWEVAYHPGPRCPTAEAAFRAGLRLANDTDDFLIAEVDGDRMVNLRGSDMEALNWDPDDYREVATGIGLTSGRGRRPTRRPEPDE